MLNTNFEDFWGKIVSGRLKLLYEAERHRPAPRLGAAPLVPFLAAPRVGQAAVWASVPFGTYQVAGASQMG